MPESWPWPPGPSPGTARPLTLTQWLIFTVFPLQQSVCLITMFRLYAQFPEAVNWPRMSVLILLFAVSDVALFCLIGQTAGRRSWKPPTAC